MPTQAELLEVATMMTIEQSFGCEECRVPLIVAPVEAALGFNKKHPGPVWLGRELLAIRREHGPSVLVGMCGACGFLASIEVEFV